jgi:hypothetical protein
MLPVIPHNPIPHHHERFVANFAFCAQCPDLSTATGLCKNGIDHQSHCNADYCPAGKFGGAKPSNWPHELEGRVQTCQRCRAKAGHLCGIDQASIRDHARAAVCPIGRFADGTTGNLPTPTPPPANVQPGGGAVKKGCCGGK